MQVFSFQTALLLLFKQTHAMACSSDTCIRHLPRPNACSANKCRIRESDLHIKQKQSENKKPYESKCTRGRPNTNSKK